MLSPSMRFWFPTSIISLLVLSFMSNDLFIPSMPQLMNNFGVSANVIQNSISMWFLGSMSLQIILGPISDQYGRKIILLCSAVILIFSSLFCAYSTAIMEFLLGRFLQGMGVSGIMVTAFATLHEVYEKENNGTKILGLVGSTTALSPLVGPLIGGYVSAYFGWQANFYATFGIGLFLVLLLSKYMPETITKKPERIQWKQIGTSYLLLLTNRNFITTVSCYGLLFFAGGAFLAVAPFIFVNLLNLPAEYVGYGMMPMFICYMITSSLASKLELRFSADKIIGYTLFILSLLMLIFILGSYFQDNNTSLIIVGIAFYYIGLGLVGPPLNNISLSEANSACKGAASALLTVTMMLGSALGALALSYVYNDHLLPIAFVMGSAIILAFLAFGIYLIDPISRKSSAILE